MKEAQIELAKTFTLW